MTSAMRTARRSYRPIFAQNLSTDGVRQLLGSYRKSANGAIVDDFKLQPGFLYTQVRAISARINQNFDGWPSQELKKYYRTFLGKPVFVNHQNFDPTKARGRVVAARYVENGNDRFVEVIQEIDAQRFPKLAHEIRTGGLDSVSMGVEAGFTKCSICDNKATDLHDMCSHVKYHKGSYLPHAKTGKRTLVYENCYKLGFFELSYVFDPADETAVVSKVLVANRRTANEEKPTWIPHIYKNQKTGESYEMPPPDPSRPVYTHYFFPAVRKQKKDQVPQPNLWSVGQTYILPNGEKVDRVHGYTNQLHLSDVRFKVDPKAAQKGLETGVRGVFAKVHGMLPGPVGEHHRQPDQPIPYSSVNFRHDDPRVREFHHRDNLEPIFTADEAHFTPDAQMYASQSDNWNRPHDPVLTNAPHPSLNASNAGRRNASRRYAYGEIEAPEDVDTLRNNDKTEDNQFHHYVESPRELRTPDMDNTIRQDQKQEEQGLDDDRRAEAVEELNPADGGKKIVEPDVVHEEVVNDFLDWCDSINVEPSEDALDDFSNAYHLNNEDYQAVSDFLNSVESDGNGAGPTSNANQPVPHMSRRKMATYRYAEESQPPWLEDSQGFDDGSQGFGDDEDQDGFSDGGFDEDGLLEQLEQLPPEELQAIIEQIQGDVDGDGDMDANPDAEYEEDVDGDGDHDDDDHHYDDYADVDGDGDHDEFDHHADEFGDDNTGPMMDVDPSGQVNVHQSSRNGKYRTSSQKKRGTQKGKPMARETLASRGRKAASRQRLHRLANDNGHFDSGPYDENNQGEQEEIFISQTPGEEGVAAPVPGDGTISNTERNLVARINAQKNSLQRDIMAWNQIQQYKSAGQHEFGDPAILDPVNPYTGMSETATPPGSFGPTNNGVPKHQASRYAADGGLPDADTVNPELSGTDDQSLKGDFERVQPDKVETQSKDASLKAFAAFDNWLLNTTGRTASQHGNANFIRRQAARWAGSSGYPVEVLFPALGNFLRQARRIEGGNMRRTADEKLEVAAPQDRIDVEAPVSNVTDAEAQASQFDLGDFGGNASDNVADPDLSTDSQIWAPGEGVKESNRKADGVAAIRLAEAYIRAGLKPEGEKYNLVAQFQTMRHATVTDRTRLLEAVLRTAAYNRRVTAGTNRGTAPRKPFPPGLMNGGGMSRSASVNRTAANDPSTDSDLFL